MRDSFIVELDAAPCADTNPSSIITFKVSCLPDSLGAWARGTFWNVMDLMIRDGYGACNAFHRVGYRLSTEKGRHTVLESRDLHLQTLSVDVCYFKHIPSQLMVGDAVTVGTGIGELGHGGCPSGLKAEAGNESGDDGDHGGRGLRERLGFGCTIRWSLVV